MKLRHDESGMVLPLAAVSLAVLLGFAGVAVDAGYLEYRQQAQQNAADAAAIGGAQAIVRSGCPNSGVATTAADNDASTNGFANNGNGTNTTVTVNNPPMSGPFSSNGCAVDVKITTKHVATFFARLFGYAQGMSESTEAVAAVQASYSSACIYLLSPTVQANFNGANVNSPGCGIAINDTANFNGATFLAPSIGYAGPAPNENGATFKLATPAPMLPIADPCMDATGCAYLANNPPPTNSCTSFNGNGYNGALAAGCYSSLNLNGANVTMSGTYVLSGSSNFNGAHITGTNVTIYVTNGGTPPNFNGATANLAAPTSGSDVGVLYYQVPSNTGSANFNGTNNYYSGLIYCPGATSVNFNGAHGGYVVLVFGSTNFNGSSAVDLATPPPGGAIVKQAVLAQ